MAVIVPSKLHPAEEVFHSLPGGEFSLAPDGSYETDDPALIENAYASPWLDVKPDEAVEYVYDDSERRLDPRKDVLAAAHGSEAFNPEAIKAVEDEKRAPWLASVAVESGLDQEKKTVEAGIAQTIAAQDVVQAKASKAANEKGDK